MTDAYFSQSVVLRDLDHKVRAATHGGLTSLNINAGAGSLAVILASEIDTTDKAAWWRQLEKVAADAAAELEATL